jgi:general stress protein 26
MGITKDLDNSEGIKKLKEIAEEIRVCMFCTGVDSLPFETRPMSTLQVDEDGNFWFFSAIDSNKNFEILQDDQVQLIYSKPSDSHFMIRSCRLFASSRSRRTIGIRSTAIWFL